MPILGVLPPFGVVFVFGGAFVLGVLVLGFFEGALVVFFVLVFETTCADPLLAVRFFRPLSSLFSQAAPFWEVCGLLGPCEARR